MTSTRCAHCEKVEQENENLRNTVHTLIAAQRQLLDSIGIWTMPTIPNN